jgi:signal transduction histidine kinase
MFDKRIRRHARGARTVALLTITPVVPVLLAQDQRVPGELLRSSQLVAFALVLGAAVFVYFHWRISSSAPEGRATARLAGWLTVGLLLAGLPGVLQGSLLEPDAARQRNDWPIAAQIAVLVALILLTRVAARAEVPGDPAFVGVVGGLLFSAGTWGLLRFAPRLVLHPASERMLSSLSVVMGLVLAWAILRQPKVSSWARQRLALSVVLVTAAQPVRYAGIDDHIVIGTAVVSTLLGAAVLCNMTHVMFRGSVVTQVHEIEDLQETLAEVRAAVLKERELLHEVGSTVAGITTAARVMRQGTLLSAQRRDRLERTMEAELARLGRLMSSRAQAPTMEFDVDDIVGPLVTSHRERGLDIDWSPSHARALGDPDDFAEVVNILLENAGRHGRGAVRLEASALDGSFELSCSDDGPGVADEVRERLFTSGVRRPDSPGQGLGLAIARRLMWERRGSLELIDSPRPGATFVARLPSSELAHAASHNVA